MFSLKLLKGSLIEIKIFKLWAEKKVDQDYTAQVIVYHATLFLNFTDLKWILSWMMGWIGFKAQFLMPFNMSKECYLPSEISQIKSLIMKFKKMYWISFS